MLRVDDDAEALVGCYANGEADKEKGKCEEAVPAGSRGQDQEEGQDDATGDVGDARVSDKEHAGFVAVAD